jgi:hypothetical protein
MAKTKKKEKKYTPAITKRILLIMEEVIKEGVCDTVDEFMTSIGEHRTSKSAYEDGSRAPTPEQIAITCAKFGYSPTWVILGIGEKKLNPKNQTPLEDRVSELETVVQSLKNMIKRKK